MIETDKEPVSVACSIKLVFAIIGQKRGVTVASTHDRISEEFQRKVRVYPGT